MMMTEPRTATSHAGLMLYATLCASLVGVIFLTNWPTYHMMVLGGPLARWYYLLPGLLLIPVLFAEPATTVRFFRDPLFQWFVVYILSALVWLIFAPDYIDEATRYTTLRLWAFFFFFTLTILISHSERRFLALVVIGCVALACVFNWIDVLRPHLFVPRGMIGAVPGRGAGTFVNPNAAAAAIVMGTMIALPFVPMRLRAPLLVAALVGLAPTSSRSGFLYAGVLILGAITLRLLNRVQVLVLAIALPVLVAATAIYYDRLMQASDISRLDRIVLRLLWFEDVEEEDGSVASRKLAAAHARDMFLDKPVTGHGLGSTSLESLADSPHNMYLMLGAEQGVLGLALYVMLIALLYLRGRRLARMAETREEYDVGKTLILYAAFLAVQGLFSHNVLEEPHGIFAVAFLSAAAWSFDRRRAAAASLYPAPAMPVRGIRSAAARKAGELGIRARQGGAPGRT